VPSLGLDSCPDLIDPRAVGDLAADFGLGNDVYGPNQASMMRLSGHHRAADPEKDSPVNRTSATRSEPISGS
jgi:hypothetical protein